MIEVSVFRNATAVSGATISTIDLLFECIRIGGKDGNIRNTITMLRQSPIERKMMKKSLPCITWQGIFNYRNDAGLQSLSGLMCIDIDHKTEEELIQLRSLLMKEPWVVSIFLSPSGDGLKVIILTDNYNKELYKNYYKQVEKHFDDNYGIKTDKNCEALSQGCFASYDPNIYVNLNATPIPISYDPAYDDTKQQAHHKQCGNDCTNIQSTAISQFLYNLGNGISDDELLEIMDRRFKRNPTFYTDGHRTITVFVQASELCKAGIPYNMALDYLKSCFMPTGFDESKVEYESMRAYTKNKNAFGSERFKYRP